MYVERPSLKLPADEQKIWRYMSFTKFVSMLDSGKLHFARSDTFIDKFESAIPARDLATAREYYARLLPSSVIDTGVTTFERRVVREYVRDFLGLSLDEANAISDDQYPRLRRLNG